MAEENLLILDVGEKWQRVDAYVDKLIIDEELQKCFFKNPNKVMSDLGIYHVSSDKPTAITNRIFYAIIANRELMNLVIESRDYVNFQTQQNQSISRPLKQQGVQNRARSNDHALKPYLKNKNFLRKCMLILLEDLNKKGILNEKLSRKQVMLYVEKIVTHASNGKPFSRKTPLMKYQSPYPIKKEYNLAEVNAGSEAEAHASFDARSDGTNAVTLRSLDLTNKDLVHLAELTNIPKGRTNSATVKLSDALSFASDFTLLVQYLQGEKFSIK